MPIVNAPSFETPAVVARQWLRNGRVPDSWWQSVMAQHINQAGLYLGKEVCSFSVPIANIPTMAGAGTTARWRHYFRTGPFARYLMVRALTAGGRYSGGTVAVDSAVTWALNEEGVGALGTLTMKTGSSGSVPTDTPAFFKAITTPFGENGSLIEVSPDTAYSGLWADVNNGRLVSVSAWEVSLDPTIANGYIEGNYTAGSPIYDEDRGDMVVAARNLWKQAGAHLTNWSRPDASPRTTTSATSKNAIDDSSTTVSAATPGWTLDLRNRARLASSNVPCRIAVYAKQSSGSGGRIRLKDSGGTALVSLTINSSTAAWYTATVGLPATLAKYDLHLESDGAQTCSLYAMSLYRYEA